MPFSRLAVLVAFLAALAIFVPPVASRFVASLAPVDSVPAAPPGAGQVASSARRVVLAADGSGHFVASATINGRAIDALVDTGATLVALNEETAGRLGLHPSRMSRTVLLSTANGPVLAAPVTLDEVRIGGISVRDVEAVVVPGGVLDINLLGMSYLSRLTRYQAGGGQLMLEQ
jgi:aspartyl protease family protein